MMLIANDLKEYPAPTKLRNHYAKRITKTLEYICYLEANGDNALAGDPTNCFFKHHPRLR